MEVQHSLVLVQCRGVWSYKKMAKYKLLWDSINKKENGVLLKSDDSDSSGLGIPFDPSNTDYQEYLAWGEEGNTADPADKD